MSDNKTPKLRVSKVEASEKIRDRINMGKELFESQIFSEEEFTVLKQKTSKWTEYNRTLFDNLFDESPLSPFHGSATGYIIGQSFDMELSDHKENISSWSNDLESIYEQLELYEELPSNTQQVMNADTMNNENKKGQSFYWKKVVGILVTFTELHIFHFQKGI